MKSDSSHPFFRPLWRRIAVLAVCFGWSAFEWANGETFWCILTLGMGAYGIWVLIINYDAGPSDNEPAPPAI